MTNEEIVIRIQDGETSLYSLLWDRTKKLIFQIMKSKLHGSALPNYISIEDLEQEMYFALCKAVNYYDRDKSTLFTSYLNYPILTVLNHTVFKDGSTLAETSYNAPINSENSDEKIELIIDKESENAFYNIELTELQETVRQAVAALKERERAAVTLHYFHNRSYEDIATLLHINRARAHQLVGQALSALRRNPSIMRLHREQIHHITHNEERYMLYEREWTHSIERLTAEIELSVHIQKGDITSYGKQRAFMEIAKRQYISSKISETAELRRAVYNKR